MSQGRKDDQGKPDLSLIPLVALIKEAEAFEVGKARYGRYNFYKGMEASRIMAALLRHAHKWFEGEECDPDGQHHLGSVRACAAMLLKTQELGTLIDDRYQPDPIITTRLPDGITIEWGAFNESKNNT